MEKKNDLGLLLIRLITGGGMILYGIGKVLYGVDFIENLLVENKLPSFFAYGVYVGEIIAPVLIVIGFRVRMAALILLVNCLTIILLSQTQNIFSLNQHGGWALELLGFYSICSVALFFTGAGKYALSHEFKWD